MLGLPAGLRVRRREADGEGEVVELPEDDVRLEVDDVARPDDGGPVGRRVDGERPEARERVRRRDDDDLVDVRVELDGVRRDRQADAVPRGRRGEVEADVCG